MKKKSIIAILASISVVALLNGCADRDETLSESETVPPTDNTEQISKTFTLDELSQYTGMDGNKAYIAINGMVYDVTNMMEFQVDGAFYGKAGMDLSTELRDSPEYESMFNEIPIIGRITP